MNPNQVTYLTPLWNVYDGDGNHGTYLVDRIEARDEIELERTLRLRGYFIDRIEYETDDSDETFMVWYATEGPNGETALNGGAFHVIEAWHESDDPRV